MCLIYSKKMTEKMRKRLQKTGQCVFYKVYLINGQGIVSHYWRPGPVRLKNGCIISDRKTTKITEPGEIDWDDSVSNLWDGCYIYRGIHVYVKNPSGTYSDERHLVIPVIGKLKDFVAADDDFHTTPCEAVFTKIYIDYDKIVKAAKDKKFPVKLWKDGKYIEVNKIK